jgi:ribonuclease BN (tRNA processing enzyme)
MNCPFVPWADAQTCGGEGVAVQVLGSGGPELQDKRASSSYLVWQDGQARVLVDAGGGSALRFGESGAKISQLDVILFTHFHVDHSADFPALIFSSWFEERDRPLPVYGPAGNSVFPSTVGFVHAFFKNRNGVYRYLSELLVPQEKGSYKFDARSGAEKGMSRCWGESGRCLIPPPAGRFGRSEERRPPIHPPTFLSPDSIAARRP